MRGIAEFRRAAMLAQNDSETMSDNEQPHPKKKVTAATTDAPQEEFVSPENIPSHADPTAEEKQRAQQRERESEPPSR